MLLWNVLQICGFPDVGLLFRSERALLDPLTSLSAGDQGDKRGVDLLQLANLQVLSEPQVVVPGDLGRRE